MQRTKRDEPHQLDIVPLVDPDFVRCEQNLMRIGFFSASMPKADHQPAKRVLRMVVKRDGRKVDTQITFEGSSGLPTIVDCDKYMGFLRIAAAQRRREGRLTNPVRFPGLRLLREVGLSDAGLNYEELVAWGQRMAKTTITSKLVVYLANSRKFADTTLSVFQKFSRIGQQDASGRSEEYEVWLADWLLENLNADYIYLEELGPYLQLNKPIAKAIYHLLHFWFTTNKGEPFIKDYVDVCELLNIKSYGQKSRIIHSLRDPLDELVAINYLSKWELDRRLQDDTRWKITFYPGEALLKNLDIANPYLPSRAKTPALLTAPINDAAADKGLTTEALIALQELHDLGIFPDEAKKLIAANEPGKVLDMLEYVKYLASSPGNNIRSAQSLLVTNLRKGTKIPSEFVTDRQRRITQAAREWEYQVRQHNAALELEYVQWSMLQGELELERRLTGVRLREKIQEVIAKKSADKAFAQIPGRNKAEVARNALIAEIRGELMLPTFEEWCNENAQRDLFANEQNAQTVTAQAS